ncbi:MAG: serine hydrolase, partial [Coriobacteriales bacterium]|nr:serine hydrolase [Coriobacteriales bacterium]
MSQKYKIAKKQDEQAAQASKPRPEERAPKRKEARWVVVVRAILLAIVAIALVSGVLLSTVTNALGEVLQTDTIDGSSVQQVQQQTNDIPDIEAAYAGLSTSDGQVLYTRSPDTQVPMASTTKIMTAVVALESGTSLDTPMKITDGAAGTEGSTANLKSGMVISFHDLLYGMLLPSGNDAAVAIAQNIATTESRFVDMMNSKASDLGMTSTHYADATGLSDTNHYTTVNDYLKLARYAMQNSTFRQIVSTPTYTMTTSDGTTITVQSTDEMSDYLQGTGIT